MSEPAGDRRRWPRIPASSLTNVRASIVAGPDVSLVNLSCGGALLEVGARYAMRAFVRLKLTRSTGETAVVPGTVSWSRVGTIAGGRINYLVAVIFEQPIADLATVTGCPAEEIERARLPEPAAVPDAARSAAAADPPPDPARSPVAAADESRTLQLAAAEARVESLRHELDAATTDLTNLTLTNDALSAQLDSVGLELHTLREELEGTRRRAAEQQARLAEEVAATAARTAALEAALDARETEHTGALVDQRTRLDAELAALAQTVSVQQEDHARLLADRERLEAERSALLEQIAHAAAAADAVRAAIDTREQEHARILDEQRARFDGTLEELTNAVTRNQAELAHLVAERAHWEAERASLVEQLASATATAVSLRAAGEARDQEHARVLDEQRAHFDHRIQELIDTGSHHQAEHARLVAERERWAVERAAILEQLADATAAAETLRGTVEAREQEHASALSEQRARFEVRIQELTDAVSRHQTEQAELVAEREQWECERSTLLEQLAGAVAAADALRTAYDAHRQEHVRILEEQQAHHDLRVQELLDEAARSRNEHAQLVTERDRWEIERAGLIEQMVGAAAKAEALQAERTQLVAERESWSSERSSLLEQLANALTRADDAQTALEAREQEHVQERAAEQARYETLIAELIQASHDQHTEYQHVLAEQTAAREKECARADRHEAALVGERAAAERERSELEVRIEALEALCAAHETRYRTLRRDAERLVLVLEAPVTGPAPQDTVASFAVQNDTEHAVA